MYCISLICWNNNNNKFEVLQQRITEKPAKIRPCKIFKSFIQIVIDLRRKFFNEYYIIQAVILLLYILLTSVKFFAASNLVNAFLRLLENQNALHLPVFSVFFSTAFPEYRGIWSKKIFYRPSNSLYKSVICCYKKTFFRSILFLDKLLRNSLETRHLFIYMLLK